MLELDWTTAEQALKQGLALDPTSESVQGLYGSYLTRTLQFEEAVHAMDRALAINPLASGPQANLVIALAWLGHNERLEVECREMLELNPLSAAAHVCLGHLHMAALRFSDAVSAFESAVENTAGSVPLFIGLLGYAHARADDRDRAQALSDHLKQLGERGVDVFVPMSLIAVGLGQTVHALDLLEQAYEERSLLLMDVGTIAPLRVLGSEPRFRVLLRALNLSCPDCPPEL